MSAFNPLLIDLILKGYALCRRPLETGGSCLPLRRKHIGQKLQLSLCTEAI